MLGSSAVTVPYGADETLYIVVDRFSAAKEIRIERIDLEAIISDLIAGCFSEPLRVQAFNTLEHWMKDISADVAAEIQSRCDIDGVALPEHLRDFVESHLDCGHDPAASRNTGSRPHHRM
jgi:hypothetical protein